MTDATANLLREADRSAEVLIGFVRLGVAVCLGVLVAATIHKAQVDPTLTFVVIAAYAGLGVASIFIARSRFFSASTPFFLIIAEGMIVAFGLYVGVATSDASPAWLMATPSAIWAIIVLTLQSLRFRIELQAFASVVILTALIVVATVTPERSSVDGAAFLASGFDPLSNAVRFFLLILLSLALTVSVWRSRLMLGRIKTETEASMNLGRFLPQEIRAQASVEGIEKLKKGRAISAAIIFVDIRGFTAMSEAVGPRRISEFLTKYRSVVTRIVAQHGGIVDKFVGDGALIFFGDHEEPAEAASKAIAFVTQLDVALSNDVQPPIAPVEGQPPFVIVAHFGEVLVGAFGEDDRLEFTIIGSPVNETARLESVAKQRNAAVVVSAALFDGAGHGISDEDWIDLGEVSLRGSGRPQRIFKIRRIREETKS